MKSTTVKLDTTAEAPDTLQAGRFWSQANAAATWRESLAPDALKRRQASASD